MQSIQIAIESAFFLPSPAASGFGGISPGNTPIRRGRGAARRGNRRYFPRAARHVAVVSPHEWDYAARRRAQSEKSQSVPTRLARGPRLLGSRSVVDVISIRSTADSPSFVRKLPWAQVFGPTSRNTRPFPRALRLKGERVSLRLPCIFLLSIFPLALPAVSFSFTCVHPHLRVRVAYESLCVCESERERKDSRFWYVPCVRRLSMHLVLIYIYIYIYIYLFISLRTRRSIPAGWRPTLRYAGGCSDMNLRNKEHPRVELRSV